MKVIHSKYYNYVGKVHGLHLFVCTKRHFDPEVIAVSKAKLINQDGSFIMFGPDTEGKAPDAIYSGIDAEGKPYSFNLEFKA